MIFLVVQRKVETSQVRPVENSFYDPEGVCPLSSLLTTTAILGRNEPSSVSATESSPSARFCPLSSASDVSFVLCVLRERGWGAHTTRFDPLTPALAPQPDTHRMSRRQWGEGAGTSSYRLLRRTHHCSVAHHRSRPLRSRSFDSPREGVRMRLF